MGFAVRHGWWIVLCAFAVATQAVAQSAHDILTVRTTVRPQCRVQAEDLDLGLYDPAGPARATSAIQIQCTPGVVATIGLNGGRSGDPLNRAMRAEGHLRYQLYKDPARTQVFADRNVAETQTLRATGLPQRILVHGEAPAGQSAREGRYVDLVVVTVTY